MTCNPAGPYLLCISFNHGNDSLQGSHHEAQKSTYTSLPRSADNRTVPDLPGSEISGAIWPSDIAIAGAASHATAAIPAVPRSFNRCFISMSSSLIGNPVSADRLDP